MDKEGIFRLSASASDINLYKEKYNQGGDVRFPPTLDHNVPAALLKYYLRELPEPLFPFQYFSQLVEIGKYFCLIYNIDNVFTFIK